VDDTIAQGVSGVVLDGQLGQEPNPLREGGFVRGIVAVATVG
jgi:hypothetical protein